jgi:hypothetical protein
MTRRLLIPDAVHTLIYGRAGDRLHAEAEDLSELARAAIHEAGHAVLLYHVGARRIGGVRIFPDGSGYAGDDLEFAPDTPPECQIATYLAGGMAQNRHLDHWDCSGDKEGIREILDELTLDEGIEAMQKARRIAAYGLKVHAKRLVKIAQRLERTGHA